MNSRLGTALPIVLGLSLLQGCAWSIKSSQVRVTTNPPAAVKTISIEVDTVPIATNEQAILLDSLKREFAGAGYSAGSGGLVLKATIARLQRGDTAANVAIGLGIGHDEIDVRVVLSDAKGTAYMTFLARGAAIDKRYSSLKSVTEGIAKKILVEVKRATK